VTLVFHTAEPRGLPWKNEEYRLCLLGGRVRMEAVSDDCPVVSVRYKQLGDMPLGRNKKIVRNSLSQPEAGGGEQSSRFQGTWSTLHFHNPDKVLGAPDKDQVGAPLARPSLRAQFGEAAGGKEPFQAIADSRGIEGLTNLLRNNAGEVSQCQVRVTTELDVHHCLAPKVGSVFIDLCPSGPGKGEPKREAENRALDCYCSQATPSTSKRSSKVG